MPMVCLTPADFMSFVKETQFPHLLCTSCLKFFFFSPNKHLLSSDHGPRNVPVPRNKVVNERIWAIVMEYYLT